MASNGGVVRLLEVEPTPKERYSHALEILAVLSAKAAVAAAQDAKPEP